MRHIQCDRDRAWGFNHPLGGAEGGKLKNYIIRIYRQDEKDSNNVVGIVESVEAETRDNFSNMDELVKLLCRQQTVGSGITEEGIREAVKNGPTDNGPDWGEIRFEAEKMPGIGKKGKGED